MQIVDNAVIKVKLPPRIEVEVKQAIPRCQRCSDGDLLIDWNQNESEHLAQILDIEEPYPVTKPVPAPMLRDYDWPGLMTPYSHQKVTAAFLSIRMRAFCFNEQGTGKTPACIWAADYLMKIGLVKKVLIICPLSIMQTAWAADIMQTAMHRSVGIAHGNASKRLKIIQANYDFTIINYDGVSVIDDAILSSGFDLIIVDEANAYKNSTTKRWKTLARLLRPSTRLWMLTGTPASQSPADAFGLAKMVNPSKVPRFKTTWRDQVMIQISRFRWMPREDSRTRVFAALQPAIRYTKRECLDLPNVVHETRDVPLTVQVENYYKRMRNQMIIEAAGEEISAVNAAAKMTKLLQISGGAVYTDEHDVVEFDISPRLSVLEEVLNESSHKVIVFVPYIHTIQVVRQFLNKIGYSNECIQGSVPARHRAEIITRFQRTPDPKVLIIQPAAASHGVTLTAADTIVFWSPVVSVETYLQCIGRIDRVGQLNKMLIVHLQGSDVERRVYKMLQGKVDDHIKLTDLYCQELGL